jgi:acyl carrier protein
MQATENTLNDVRQILGRVLQLGDRAAHLNRGSALLGAIPEVDSMAVVQVLTAIEDHFGIAIADEDISADAFASLGALADFVEEQLG